MKKSVLGSELILAVLLLITGSPQLFAHCEIPCGIYDDQARIIMLEEHITTIEKSMKMITQLSDETPVNYNQLVRWITNKDDHAEQFQHIVWQYFMTQRIKPDDVEDGATLKSYNDKLACLHRMLVYAMKCMQTTDLANVETLKKLVDQFSDLYFDAAAREHLKEHH